MAKIERLPLHVANQIAAGEVIERPASVVKELVENALDADARRITVEVAEGARFLRITDDGIGMGPEDAVLAFERFATSKLRNADELWALATMGFRGEALASVASIAKVECQTRARGSERGTLVRIEGGGEPIVKPAGCPEGTSLTVEELFYNTPARLKFLRAAATEQGHIQDALTSLALCHPHVDFRLLINGRETLSTVGAKTAREVAASLLGDELASGLGAVDFAHAGGRVHGLVSLPHKVRGDRSKQWFFINGRWVKHPLLAKAVEEAYVGHIPGDRHPIYMLHLELDPALVDINVHPAKKEVRLGQTQSVYTLLREGVLRAFTQLSPDEAVDWPPSGPSPHGGAAGTWAAPRGHEPSAPAFTAPREAQPSGWAQPPEGFRPSVPQGDASGWLRPAGRAIDTAAAMAAYRPIEASAPEPRTLESQTIESPMLFEPEAAYASGLPRELDQLRVIAQLHRTYILCEHPDGLFLIDQHNSHERWLYEQLTPAAIVSQELLLPIVMPLSPRELAAAEELQARLGELGFGFEPFGTDDWVLRAIPALLPLDEAERTVRELLSRTESVGVVTRQPDDDPIRRTIACHSAIKAGDVLSHEQMNHLLDRLKETHHPLTCPHGRPTGIMISMQELNKRCLRG